MAAVVALVSVSGSWSFAPALAQPATSPLTKADYDACRTTDDASVRVAIERVTSDVLKRALGGFDYQTSVQDAWRGQGMDGVLDRRVDVAVTEVGQETSWGVLLQSLADSKKAQELATAVAERVYRSEPVVKGIEAVAADVGRTLSLSLELASEDATKPAMACLKAFLGPRYGSAIADVVTADATTKFAVEDDAGKARVSAGAVLSQTGGGLAGAAILLLRRQLGNLAGQVGRRIVGSVLARLVSVAAGGVGAVLIAKDIWELRTGVLPIVATEMKAAATKDLVRVELARAISEQIGQQVDELSSASAARVMEIWQEFKVAHGKALALAEREPRFRDFLDRVTAARLPRLDEVVALVLAAEGEPALLARLTDGTLDTAVNKLSPDGMTIARETRSLTSGLKWASVAGADLLPKVLAYELHKRMPAADVTRAALTRLLAVEDKLAVTRLAGLSTVERTALFELEPAALKALARALPEGELSALSGYLTGLDARARARILAAVATTPAKMRLLAATGVRTAIAASRDQLGAVDLMLRDGPSSVAQIGDDIRAVADGRIDPWLVAQRHPLVLGGAVFAALVLLMLLWRVFSGPRRRAAPAGPA